MSWRRVSRLGALFAGDLVLLSLLLPGGCKTHTTAIYSATRVPGKTIGNPGGQLVAGFPSAVIGPCPSRIRRATGS